MTLQALLESSVGPLIFPHRITHVSMATARAGRVALLLPWLGACVGPCVSAASAQTTGDAPLVTLGLWADDVWLSLLDRDGSYFGRLAEEGTFQRFHPSMDDEYELDVLTGLSSSDEDARWSASDEGVRATGTSISHHALLHALDWRHTLPVSGPVDVLVRYRRQHSLSARRDYPGVGLRWSGVGGSPWTLSTTLGVHFFKPSADLELAAERRWGRPSEGESRLELRIALLDTFSDVVFQGLGVTAEDTPAHFDYERLPLAARAFFTRVSRRLRVEIHAGTSARTEVQVTFPATGAQPYTLLERVRFAGGLAEAKPAERVTMAVYGAAATAHSERRFDGGDPQGPTVEERTTLLGVALTVEVGPQTRIVAGARQVGRPEERSTAGREAARHSDRERTGWVALRRRPDAGWSWGVLLVRMDRKAGVMAPWLTGLNERFVAEWGHRFPSGFEVTAGLRWDLDNFRRKPFDGGHLRFTSRW